ncbi:MAG: CBS domain-containing protein [Nocardioidaceae bacterium]|nr:CBS domain-containing protein [Nocardioidaceae bacterium]NUS51516.1 CBS domain-containing protein [Nocardioidaceae bacterium]
MWVRDVMTCEPVSVRPETAIKTALRLLDRYAVTSLPVVDAAGRLVGVLSEADVLRDAVRPDVRNRMVLAEGDPPARPRCAADVMSTHPVSVRPETDLADAVELMTSSAIKSLPVVDARARVVGMVSRRDVVHSVATSDEDVERAVVAMFGFLGVDWLVDVNNGVARVEGPAGAKEQALAETAVQTVPGVIGVTVT